MGLQRALKGAGTRLLQSLYPPQCLSCAAPVAEDFGLCPACWRDTPFVTGAVCDACGVPLPGEADGADEAPGAGPIHCDDCLATPRPWDRGRAAMLYRDNGRRFVLALKHGDRMDMARTAGRWMAQSGAGVLEPGQIVAPVPLHWTRLLRRRYNQSALLAGAVARQAGLVHCPDLLERPRRTGSQDGRDREGRFANLDGALRVAPRHASRLDGRPVLVVDDVMTSGATLAAATVALRAAGAARVSVLVLARVAKEA